MKPFPIFLALLLASGGLPLGAQYPPAPHPDPAVRNPYLMLAQYGRDKSISVRPTGTPRASVSNALAFEPPYAQGENFVEVFKQFGSLGDQATIKATVWSMAPTLLAYDEYEPVRDPGDTLGFDKAALNLFQPVTDVRLNLHAGFTLDDHLLARAMMRITAPDGSSQFFDVELDPAGQASYSFEVPITFDQVGTWEVLTFGCPRWIFDPEMVAKQSTHPSLIDADTLAGIPCARRPARIEIFAPGEEPLWTPNHIEAAMNQALLQHPDLGGDWFRDQLVHPPAFNILARAMARWLDHGQWPGGYVKFVEGFDHQSWYEGKNIDEFPASHTFAAYEDIIYHWPYLANCLGFLFSGTGGDAYPPGDSWGKPSLWYAYPDNAWPYNLYTYRGFMWVEIRDETDSPEDMAALLDTLVRKSVIDKNIVLRGYANEVEGYFGVPAHGIGWAGGRFIVFIHGWHNDLDIVYPENPRIQNDAVFEKGDLYRMLLGSYPNAVCNYSENLRKFPWPQAEVLAGDRLEGEHLDPWYGRFWTLLNDNWIYHEEHGWQQYRSLEWGKEPRDLPIIQERLETMQAFKEWYWNETDYLETALYPDTDPVDFDPNGIDFKRINKFWEDGLPGEYIDSPGTIAFYDRMSPDDPDYGKGLGLFGEIKPYYEDSSAASRKAKFVNGHWIGDDREALVAHDPARNNVTSGHPTWIFSETTESQGVYLYDFEMGEWLFASKNYGRYFYRFSDNQWLYYGGAIDGGWRYFYRMPEGTLEWHAGSPFFGGTPPAS